MRRFRRLFRLGDQDLLIRLGLSARAVVILDYFVNIDIIVVFFRHFSFGSNTPAVLMRRLRRLFFGDL